MANKLNDDFQEFLSGFEAGTRDFLNGNVARWKQNASKSDDAVIMGAWGAYELGWPAVSKRYDWAGSRFRANGAGSFQVEYLSTGVSGDLAYTVAIERSNVKLAGHDAVAPMTLRVTHLFRREDGSWKLIVRHADPLMEKTAPTDVLGR